MNPKNMEQALFWRSERAAAQLFTGEEWSKMNSEQKARIRRQLLELFDREANIA